MESTGVRWIVGQGPQPERLLSYLTAAQMVPILALGISGGLLADRVNRKQLLLWTQAAMMLIAAALTAAAFLGRATPQVLIALSLLQGVSMAFNIPAWQVLTPRLVPRDELTRAIHLNGLQFNLARVLGPALAGAVMTISVAHGAAILFALNTASFLGVLLAVAGTPDAPAPPRDPASAWGRTAAALSFVFHERGPRAVFLAIVLFSMLAGPLLTMLPVFVTSVYRLHADTFGTLLAVMGCGAVAAVGLLKVVPHWYPKHHSIPAAVLGGGATILLLCLTSSVLVAAICLFFAGAFWLLTFNQAFAAMQHLVDDRMRGRVMAICNTAAFGATPLGAVLAAEIAHRGPWAASDGLGVRVGVGALAAVLAVAGLVMLIWRTPEVDGLRPGDDGHDRRPGLWRGITAAAHRPARPVARPEPTLPTEPEAPGQI
jgi:MFS family permease